MLETREDNHNHFLLSVQITLDAFLIEDLKQNQKVDGNVININWFLSWS